MCAGLYLALYPRQGPSGLYELLCLSRRANKERVARARPGAPKKVLFSITSAMLVLFFCTNRSM